MAAVNDGSCSHRVVPSQEKISRRRFNIICSPAKAIATTAVAQIVHFSATAAHAGPWNCLWDEKYRHIISYRFVDNFADLTLDTI